MNKIYDLVLFGATGFTGQRAAKYLNEHLPGATRWAIAGRDPTKLAALKGELTDVDTLIVDGTNISDVKLMVEQTHCVLSFAGPFCQFSRLVVECCAQYGVHYLDITGESAWVAEMMTKHEKTAQQTGAKIIHSCGFDSVPADIGVSMMQRYFRRRWKTEVKDIEAFYYLRGGGLNGGTLLSALEMMKRYDSADQRDPLLLAKGIDKTRVNPASYSFSSQFSPKMKRWVTPFVMESVNTKVVYRSQLLADRQFTDTAYAGISQQLRYKEFQVVKTRSQAFWSGVAMRALSAFGGFAPVTALLKSFGPKSGEGPSDADLQRGCFDLKLVGADESGNHGMVEMHFAGDAGNAATVMFACEAAMTLLFEADSLSTDGGFLTPATGLGDCYIKRLMDAKLSIEADVYPRLIRDTRGAVALCL